MQFWISRYRYLTILKGAYISELLTVTDDSTQRISFEVKLDIHVLPLWIGAQQLELNINDVNIHCEREKKKPAQFTVGISLQTYSSYNAAPPTNHKLLWNYWPLWRESPPLPSSSYWMTKTNRFRLHPSFCLKLRSENIQSCVFDFFPPSDVLIADMSSEQAKLYWWVGSS